MGLVDKQLVGHRIKHSLARRRLRCDGCSAGVRMNRFKRQVPTYDQQIACEIGFQITQDRVIRGAARSLEIKILNQYGSCPGVTGNMVVGI